MDKAMKVTKNDQSRQKLRRATEEINVFVSITTLWKKNDRAGGITG